MSVIIYSSFLFPWQGPYSVNSPLSKATSSRPLTSTEPMTAIAGSQSRFSRPCKPHLHNPLCHLLLLAWGSPVPPSLHLKLPYALKTKMADFTSGLSFGSSAVFELERPAAFRPLLTEGLAFSRTKTKPPKRYSNLLGAPD